MPKLDITSLEQSFNLDEIRVEAKALRGRIKNLAEYDDPNKILQANIARANILLDRIEEAIDNDEGMGKGGIGRLMEVAANLINAVTTASSAMMSMSFNADEMEYKEKVLTLKELEYKAKLEGKTPSKAITQNNNILVTDRNSLLEMLRSNQINSNDVIEASYEKE